MRLKLIAHVNFQYSEAENFQLVMKKHRDMHLGPGDVLCMLSQSEGQMVFMYRPTEMELTGYGARKGTATVYRSLRLRLDRSKWDWRNMLQNYANDVGIHLEGLSRFEDIYEGARRGHKTARKETRKSNVISIRGAA